MKSILTCLCLITLLMATPAVFAEDDSDSLAYFPGWKKSLDLDLTVAQSSYSDNWTGGEAGSFTWVSNANGIFTKWLNQTFRLKNFVKLSFGQTMTQDQDTKKWSKPEKSSDKIDLESVGLFNLHTWVEPFVAGRFESQFLDASNDAHQEYIDPMLLTFSGGVAKPLYMTENDEIMTRLGLAAKHYRNRFFNEVSNSDDTETVTEGGIESNTDIKIALGEKLGYIGKLTVYKAFAITDEDTQPNDYWKAVDINWENTISASVSKFIKVSFYTQFLYDKQISKKGRVKETLALGITYKMM